MADEVSSQDFYDRYKDVVEGAANEGIFNPVASDVSVQFLASLFGPNWIKLLGGDFGDEAEFQAANVLFEVLAAFNTVILAGLGFLISYVVLIAAIASGHHGETMGKQYSWSWAPTRMVIAVAMLMPIPGVGISFIQGALLAVVGASIGAANHVQSAALDYMEDTGGSLIAPSAGSSEGGILESDRMVLNTFMHLAAQHYLLFVEADSKEWDPGFFSGFGGATSKAENRAQYLQLDNRVIVKNTTDDPEPPDHPRFSGIRNNPTKQIFTLDFRPPPAWDDSAMEGVFKEMTTTCELGSDLCSERMDATNNLIKDLDKLAFDTIRLWEGAIAPSDEILTLSSTYSETGFGHDSIKEVAQGIYEAREDYHEALIPEYEEHREEALEGLKEDVKKFTDTARDAGWAMTGAWYWTLQNLQQRALESFGDPVYIDPPNISKIKDVIGTKELGPISNFMKKASHDVKALVNTDGGVESEELKEAAQVGDKDEANIMQHFMDLMVMGPVWRHLIGNPVEAGVVIATEAPATSGDEDVPADPISIAMSRGQQFMNAGQIGLFLGMAGDAAGKVMVHTEAGGAVLNALSFGFLDSGTSYVGATVQKASKLLLSFSTYLLLTGTALVYYIPFIPISLWIMAFVGWVILVLESIVAAPLWAAAHAAPEGEGMAGDRGRQGYMLFLAVFLRPPLMVIGFFMAYLLLQYIMDYVRPILDIFVAQTTNEPLLQQVLGMFAMILITSGLLVALVHKVFGLVNYMPENVPRWLGQQMHSLGESHDEQQGRNIMMAGKNEISRKGKEGLSGGGSGGRPGSGSGSGSEGSGSDSGGGRSGGKPTEDETRS